MKRQGIITAEELGELLAGHGENTLVTNEEKALLSNAGAGVIPEPTTRRRRTMWEGLMEWLTQPLELWKGVILGAVGLVVTLVVLAGGAYGFFRFVLGGIRVQ